MGRGGALLLIEAGAVDRAYIGKEKAARRRTGADIDVALVEFNDVLAVDDLLGTGDEGVDSLFQRVEPFAVVNEAGPLGVELAFQRKFLFGQAELFEVAMQLQ